MGQMVDRQMSTYTGMDMSDRQMLDRQMAERQMADRQMADRQISTYTGMDMSDRQMADRQMAERQMADRQMSGDRHFTDRRLSGGMDERRVYDERLRMMSDRRMADRRMADRRHLLPAYRQRFNNELNEFNSARRTINNNERSRLFKREAGFDYNVVASPPAQTQMYTNMLPFGGNR